MTEAEAPAGPGRRRWLAGALLLVAALAAARVAVQPREGVLTLDERDYLRAAVHLARDGVLSHAPLEARPRAGDAYREPGYPALLAAVWSATGEDCGFGEEDFAGGPAAARARRTTAALHLALLGLAAAAAAAAVAGLGGGVAAALLAGAATLASPALAASSARLASENLAAPVLALTGAALVASVRGRGVSLPLLAGVGAGLLPLVRGAGLVAAPAGALLLLLVPASLGWRRRAARALAFGLPALLLPAAWVARNLAVAGHPVLADRTGAVLQVRLELDRQVAEEGLGAALLEWTPSEAAASWRERIAPDSRLSSFRWRGEGTGNYFTRAIRRWRSVREASGDPLGADRELASAAVAGFLAAPGEHLAATVAVAWRGLFAERSPAVAGALDLRLPLGLGLLAGSVILLVRGARRRDPRPLALLALPLALFLFHAGATEFLPRFGVPSLPLVWAAGVAAVFGLPDRAGPRGQDVDGVTAE